MSTASAKRRAFKGTLAIQLSTFSLMAYLYHHATRCCAVIHHQKSAKTL